MDALDGERHRLLSPRSLPIDLLVRRFVETIDLILGRDLENIILD